VEQEPHWAELAIGALYQTVFEESAKAVLAPSVVLEQPESSWLAPGAGYRLAIE
jgi:hypothetical protein